MINAEQEKYRSGKDLWLDRFLYSSLSSNCIWRKTVFPEKESCGWRLEGRGVKELDGHSWFGNVGALNNGFGSESLLLHNLYHIYLCLAQQPPSCL